MFQPAEVERYSKPCAWVAAAHRGLFLANRPRGSLRGPWIPTWQSEGRRVAIGIWSAYESVSYSRYVPWSARSPHRWPLAPTQRALLIGINTYQPAGTTAEHPAGCIYGRCELGAFQNLDGSVNDAQAMADLLTSPKFGFPAGQVVLLTNPAPPQPRPGVVVLPAGQTTRDGILAAMQKYLVDVPQKGDTVVFYDASHGSLRVNSKGNKLTVLVNGQYVHADSTLVPSDAYKGGYDVRDREMTPHLQCRSRQGHSSHRHLRQLPLRRHQPRHRPEVSGAGAGLRPARHRTKLPTRRPAAPRTASGKTIPRWSFLPRSRTRRPRRCRLPAAQPSRTGPSRQL